ncbi:MAG: regulatory signaling modulator protein AmpE [Rheinheimera sp.]|uniref:regulatory signaling modulator protein AmpE n=1 Tax=Arsukibacterium sp. UBA3155 TaxID=1946058 RepID=UPI000C8EFB6F|nr:regulatory signaling modulator protein AmpE [Arsukibacterium sp. UBA3155]MAD76632.1 regulatory signaling modulator protein AmpE [Rheinheimera sp.]|tara:strand:+ start:56117 stop:57010 length:894 start_codon:yes stop_codon:yes gene_type:complete
MTLISMLLALIIERLAVRSDAWQAHRYVRAYLTFSLKTPLAGLARHQLGQYLWLLLPGTIVALLLGLIDNRLLSLIVNTLVLLVGIGCWHYRQLYKQYLNAQERGDGEAAYLVMQQIRTESGSSIEQNSYGQTLIWLNFRYYAATVFWFLLLGVFGVITYVLVRQLQEPRTLVDNTAAADSEQTAADYSKLQTDTDGPDAVYYMTFWAQWFPTRLFGLGFALVGYFSRASNALLAYFMDFTTDNEQVLTEVALAAEPQEEEQLNTLDESSAMVQLGKRNMLFFLALAAILTLSGWLY